MSRHRASTSAARRRLTAMSASLLATAMIGIAAVASQLAGGSSPAVTSALQDARLEPPPAMVTGLDTASTDTPTGSERPAQRSVRLDVDTSLPARSGEGRRVVFSQSRQRVWLVGREGRVARTYLASGSKIDNLKPGTYRVDGRYPRATSYDYSGTMEHFVEFTRGRNAPIGFHSVPRDNDGQLVQSKAQLGQALSDGCIRQWADDAQALWDFAPLGTTVVVVA